MTDPVSPTREARQAQMFPLLAADEIARMHRFGRPRRFADGERVLETGKMSPGIYVVLSGAIRVTGRDGHGHDLPVTEHGPGNFSGEVSQLSRRPSFVRSASSAIVSKMATMSRIDTRSRERCCRTRCTSPSPAISGMTPLTAAGHVLRT